MSRRILPVPPAPRQLAAFGLVSILAAAAVAAEPNFPITPQQRKESGIDAKPAKDG